MGAFWKDAESLFETARQASGSGSDCDWAILVSPQGGIRILGAVGWTLPNLAAEHGAQTAYRVTREDGCVRLEGRHGTDTCVLRSESPAATARSLLRGELRQAGRDRPGPALLAAPAYLPSHMEAKESWTTSA